LRGLICLCVFRISYICYLSRVSGTLLLTLGVLCLDLHWLGFMGLGVVFFVTSFYYVLPRDLGVLPLLSHVSLMLLFIIYTLLFLSWWF